MENDRFIVIRKASVRPGKIVFYNQFIRKITPAGDPVCAAASTASPVVTSQLDAFAPPIRASFVSTASPVVTTASPASSMPVFNTHNFELSKKASGRIKEKISWLYELARNKTITTPKGEVFNSFKMNFITLTLPSLQAHTTAEITKCCLNQLLTELKAKKNLANYVWRLEFQKNGNVHYHIATDVYCDYTELKLIWNRCLRKLGYVQAYSDKMSKLSFAEYCNEFSKNGEVPFNILRERYGRGCATRWDSPNTVDVRSVGSAKAIAFYISKYITKKSEHGLNPIVSLREPNTTNLRLWFCSTSLSALDKIEIFLEKYDSLVDACFSGVVIAKKFIYDYCEVIHFTIKDQVNEVKKNFWNLYRRYASEKKYIPAV